MLTVIYLSLHIPSTNNERSEQTGLPPLPWIQIKNCVCKLETHNICLFELSVAWCHHYKFAPITLGYTSYGLHISKPILTVARRPTAGAMQCWHPSLTSCSRSDQLVLTPRFWVMAWIMLTQSKLTRARCCTIKHWVATSWRESNGDSACVFGRKNC